VGVSLSPTRSKASTRYGRSPGSTSGPVFQGLSGPLEVGVRPPKSVEQDGELSGDCDARAFTPLRGRQGLAPGLKCGFRRDRASHSDLMSPTVPRWCRHPFRFDPASGVEIGALRCS
jgi:hypothetical protein